MADQEVVTDQVWELAGGGTYLFSGVDDDDAALLVGVTVGDDGVELAVADTEDDVEIVSAVTEEEEDVLVVDDIGVA
ncbi:hypothetical protein INS49_014799 [Diaporthe citri]|uniref:uncharacterized protein n=1 Tax=Diaporthe citri TaxID=83186 RepID=UPI001C81837A|nr:uncharacterized protein INS49_014799 [Diaporthe citri]KAG6356924.1 hypothetical protein INS49_014799 [Diaporthe citri]